MQKQELKTCKGDKKVLKRGDSNKRGEISGYIMKQSFKAKVAWQVKNRHWHSGAKVIIKIFK